MSRSTLLVLAALLAPAPVFADGSPCAGATLGKGQQRIDQGRHSEAVQIYTCILDANPLALDAYRGRAEAELLLGRYSDAMRDYARVTAVVMPVDEDAAEKIVEGYEARLAKQPNDRAALTGAVFASWWTFDYPATLPLLDRLLAQSPDDLFGVLYRGSNRLFTGDVAGGVADFERALELAPASRDVRFIVADGYTYAHPDPTRAYAEASLALAWGLDTPRVHAILASSAFALGDDADGAYHVQQHIDLVATEVVSTAPLAAGGSIALDLVAGRVFEIPVAAVAGAPLSIRTTSPSGAIYDSIVVLEAPGGTPVVGNDDFIDYLAGFDWVVPASGTYTLRVTTFEGVSMGDLVVSRP
jgi:hypothetical protein